MEVKKQVRTARTQNLEKGQMLDCHKATITIFLLVITYILTWLPEWLGDFLSLFHLGMSSMSMYNFQVAARWIFFLSPMADPYIYALRHTKVREFDVCSRCTEKSSRTSWLKLPYASLF